ncbi:OmpA family protein [Patulibacter sp. SYSU D01012]|uniref:OmpA family protein n=1 Tax=Patulibacter sp. SYSU D01012 TaxID=2817381 RepID=UPI001B309811|nr:OmpA family protein [Patulibacter sp. SYSU D01012]
MPHSHPARFFRATALGVVAVGLVLPAAASATPLPALPTYAPTFEKATTVGTDGGPVRFVVHGRFGPGGEERIAAVTLPGTGSAPGSEFSISGVSLFEPSGTGVALVDGSFGFYDDAQPVAAAAADVGEAGRDAIAVASSSESGSAGVLHLVDPVTQGQDAFGLTGQPVALAAGRFLPGRPPVVAVSLQDGVVVFFGKRDDGTLGQVGTASGIPTGPLSRGRRTDAVDADALVASTSSAPGQVLELNEDAGAPGTYVATRVAGFGQPFGRAAGRVAADEDVTGARWFSYPDGDASTLSAFRTDGTTEVDQHVLSGQLQAEIGTPIALDLYGRGSRGTVAALDGTRLETFDVRTLRQHTTPLTSERVGAALDVDGDRRDDLVLADGASVTLYRNDTGTKEEAPAFTGTELAPSRYDAQAGIAVVRSRTFELVTPSDTDDAYECALGDGAWKACRSDSGGPAFSVPADGSYELRVRRRAAGTDFWSAPQTIAFRVDTVSPDAPVLIGGPARETTERSATFTFEGEAGGSYECRIDRQSSPVLMRASDGWEPCTSPWTVDDLALGAHVAEIRQTDAAGNQGATTTVAWTVVAPTPAAPTPTPAPATPPAAPAPTPVAPTPAPDAPIAAELAVGGPAKRGETPVATVTGRRVAVGCAAPGAADYRCTVTVTRGGRTVGTGRRTGSGVVPVDLDRATARKVQRLGGLRVRVTLTVKADDGRTSKVRKTVRLLPRKVLVVPTDGLFAFDSATPSRAADRLARRIARQLDGARTITIVGHTDARGTAAVNRRLGERRAEAFRRLLARHGFDGRVTVRSAGDTEPRTSNATERGRALNRRVEIDVRY